MSPVHVPQSPLPPLRPLSVGGQPALADIVGRDELCAQFWAGQATASRSLALNEPRRLGKSSWLRRLEIGAPPEVSFIRTSVQGVSSTAEFVSHLLRELADHRRLVDRAGKQARAFLERVEGVGAVGATLKLRSTFAARPLDTLAVAVHALADHLESDETVLIALDEFPDLVTAVATAEGPGAATAMLGTLRRFREEVPRVRWVLTGSVGLHHALRSLPDGSSYVNDLQQQPLGPISEPWARWLAGSLLLGVGLEPRAEHVAELAAVTDGIPYLLHLLVGAARDLNASGRPARTTADLFARAVGDVDRSAQSTHLLSRVDTHYEAEADLAESLLDTVAAAPVTRAQLGAAHSALADRDLRRLLEWLVLDHYVVKDGGGVYRWRYPALQRIWVQRRA